MARILTATTLVLALGLTNAAHAADAGKGKSVFTGQCAICHAVNAHASSGIGPSLFGVVGRPAGALSGYSYSSAMKNAATVWTPTHLKAYITAPAQTISGNKMPYAGLKNPAQVDDLLAYLATLK